MNNETIEKHGVVVEHKGFKIGDEVFIKHKTIRGIVTGIDTSNVYRFRVEGERYASWTTGDNIEHLAEYELRIAREEFEAKFKGKKIRLEHWKKIKYVIFDNWYEGLFFNFTDDEGNVDKWSADDNWQILEEPEEKVTYGDIDDVFKEEIPNPMFEEDITHIVEEPDLSKLAGCWYLDDDHKIRKIDCFRLDLQEPLIDEGYRSYYDLKQFETFKFCKHPSKNPEDYKDIDTFLSEVN